MTIFDFLNDILFTKKDNFTNADDETQYNQYLVNRWVSMHSPECAQYINNTVNWLYSVFDNKRDHYRFLKSVIPKVKYKHIPYIKKVKVDNTDNNSEDNVALLAQSLELSQREVKYLLEHYEAYNTTKS
mgnify:CR=1 FL=1|jgi:hypothetical protein